jgi:hypothetical protein
MSAAAAGVKQKQRFRGVAVAGGASPGDCALTKASARRFDRVGFGFHGESARVGPCHLWARRAAGPGLRSTRGRH